MKKFTSYLPSLLLGAAAFLHIRQLFAAGVDEKGLALCGLVPSWFLWQLLILAAAGAWILGRTAGTAVPARAQGIGCLCLGAGILSAGFTAELGILSRLPVVIWAVCLVCGGILAAAGVCRLAGKRDAGWMHCAGVLFFAAYLLGSFQSWSSQTLLCGYLFPLLSGICLMIVSLSVAAARTGSGRVSGFWQRMGIFCCLAALGHCRDAGLFAGGLVYLLLSGEDGQ